MSEQKCLECGQVIGWSLSADDAFNEDYKVCPQKKANRERGCHFKFDKE